MPTPGQELASIDFEWMLGGPLSAVIKAQAQAAVTTAKFIEEIGFKRNDDESFFDTPDDANKNDYDVRVAKLKIDANGQITSVDMPFISLFNVPSFEISNFDWSFNVKLKSLQSFSAKFGISSTTTSTSTVDAGLDIKGLLRLGSTMKVETTTKTDFESRFKAGREQEYNLNISIRGNSAPLPKGIETLLGIAENAAKTVAAPPAPSAPPGP